MGYVFNFSVIFDADKRRLCLLHDEESSVGISAPACRLLTVLVQNNGETLTRTWLLKVVWEDYGFTGSNSNLNNYLSELRKAINMLDPTLDIIITTPKVGIKLEANITFTALEDKENNSPDATNDNDYHHVGNELTGSEKSHSSIKDGKFLKNKNGEKRMHGILICIATLMMIITLLVLIKGMQKKIVLKNEPLTLIYETEKCRLYYLSGYSKNEVAFSNERVKKLLSYYKTDCSTGPYKDMYIYSQKKGINTPETAFFSVCLKRGSGDANYSSCQTKTIYKEHNDEN